MAVENRIHSLDFSGSYSIESKYLLAAVKSNMESLKSLRIDGENMSEEDVVQLVQNIKEDSLTSFRLYFGSDVEDEFLLLLQSRLSQTALVDFKLRKGTQFSAEALLAFFQSFKDGMASVATFNLEECLRLCSESLCLFPRKFPNLKNLSI